MGKRQSLLYVGVDFESSGIGRHDKPFVPIELGLAVQFKGLIISESWLIGGWDWNIYDWDPESAAVHNIPREEVDAAPPVDEVDAKAAAWLASYVDGYDTINVWPVGWNVQGFDIQQLMKPWMPLTTASLSRRALDLNSVCGILEGKDGLSYGRWKKNCKEYSHAVYSGVAHRARVDAHRALLERAWLHNVVAGIPPQ